MADTEWDTVTVIGSKTHGGATQYQTVIKGKGAINAAQRSGTASTEKKYASANAVSNPSSVSPVIILVSLIIIQADKGGEGQRLTKVDRENDVTAVAGVDPELGKAIAKRRSEADYKFTQKQLADKLPGVSEKDIKDLERPPPNYKKNQALINKVCNRLDLNAGTGKPKAPEQCKWAGKK